MFLYFAIGFISQLIDGSIGMAYGVCCGTFIKRAFGIPQLLTSALVHWSEIFTTAASSFSHFRLHNVDKKYLPKLIIPGIAGGITGAVLLIIDFPNIEKIVSVYLIVIGLFLIVKALFKSDKPRKKRGKFQIISIAFFGGLFDASGSGGWGPIVTTSLASTEEDTAKIIGTVNTAEFFVTVTESIIFFTSLGSIGNHIRELLFLIAGGICAAPLAAVLCKKINKKVLMISMGILVVFLNVLNFV